MVTAVNVWSNTWLPVIVTVPPKTGVDWVEIAVGLLAGDAEWVVVSARRWVKLYDVPDESPVKALEGCHEPVPMRYSHPGTVASVMLVVVLLDMVGAAGAAWAILATVTVLPEVTLPVQFAAVTTTLTTLFISSTTNL